MSRFDNWCKECERSVNEQLQLEFWASYQYHLMWSYFDKDRVGLGNIAKFFYKSSCEEREHAHNLMKYQNLRGGDVELKDITDINLEYLNAENSNDVLLSFEKALEMEQIVYEGLLKLHKSAENDPQFADFIESEYLDEQIKAINEISKYVSQLKRIGNSGHGVWDFDNHFNAEI